jgi:hypothetical protein
MRSSSVVFLLELSSQTPVSQDQLQETTFQLRDELMELNVESVELAKSGKTAEGAKAGDAFTLGALVIAVAPEMVKELVKLILDWLPRDPTRIIKIRQKNGGPEYEIKGSWKAQQLAEVMKLLARQE